MWAGLDWLRGFTSLRTRSCIKTSSGGRRMALSAGHGNDRGTARAPTGGTVRIAATARNPFLRSRSRPRPAHGPLHAANRDRGSARGIGETRPRERATTFYLGLLMNTLCHADATEQATWFDDDIDFKSEGVETLRLEHGTDSRVLRSQACLARQCFGPCGAADAFSGSRATVGARFHGDACCARGTVRPAARA